MEQQGNPNILLVGVGGIGGMTIELLAPALERIQRTCTITLMDGDIVEATNLGHQRFTKSDIGKPKQKCLRNDLLILNMLHAILLLKI